MIKQKPIGHLTKNGSRLEIHEQQTIDLLLSHGFDIELIVASNQPGSRTPDILMNGVCWEIKSPCGNSKRTLENNLRRASEQSENIIFDLRRIKLNNLTCIKELEKQFKKRNKIKRMIIIDQKDRLILL